MTTENDVREKITQFLRRNFPQIQMHGGEAVISNLDLDNESVTIHLGGACDGCGLSPMTTMALQRRLPDQVEAISTVRIETMASQGTQTPAFTQKDDEDEEEEKFPDAPF